MTTSTQCSLRKKLSSQLNNCSNNLELQTIEYLLSNFNSDGEVKGFINDLLSYGCQSGLVPELIYYSDTHAFYDKFYSDIEAMRIDYEDDMGESIAINGDLKNFMAWFAFEETIRKIAQSIIE